MTTRAGACNTRRVDRSLAGKAALITGGGKGIGRAIAARLAAAGARVAVVGREEDALRAAAEGIGDAARAYACDVRDRAAVDETVDHAAADLGGLDFLVNNAGVSGLTPITDPDDETWRAVVETNLHGAWYATRAAFRHLRGREGARILFVSSVLGKFGVPAYTAYCASKHALIGMTRALAIELAPHGIAVNAVCPGWVETEMARGSIERQARAQGLSPEEFRRRAVEAVPQRRMLDPEEVAGLVLYLCLPESKGITGQAISIDGGQTTF